MEKRHRQRRYCVRGGALSFDADTRKDVGNESSQRASGRVRIFRKRGGQLGLYLETLHSPLHYLTTILLPLLVGWRRAADPRLAEENYGGSRKKAQIPVPSSEPVMV